MVIVPVKFIGVGSDFLDFLLDVLIDIGCSHVLCRLLDGLAWHECMNAYFNNFPSATKVEWMKLNKTVKKAKIEHHDPSTSISSQKVDSLYPRLCVVVGSRINITQFSKPFLASSWILSKTFDPILEDLMILSCSQLPSITCTVPWLCLALSRSRLLNYYLPPFEKINAKIFTLSRIILKLFSTNLFLYHFFDENQAWRTCWLLPVTPQNLTPILAGYRVRKSKWRLYLPCRFWAVFDFR